ncbi:MAG: SGNH/GDSL hydrolase family protein [Eubacterium sp.]|nr:SGNH/GDSL hydrolase family protein [Eubacterium sp.]
MSMTFRHGRRIIEIMAAAAIFAGIAQQLNYIYNPIEAEGDYRATWHSYYQAEGSITNLYLGSSHIQRNVDPRILDTMTGENNFDFGTSFQRLNGTFFLLREAEKKNDLKHVYIELYYECSVKDYFDGIDPIDTDHISNWQNVDQMRLSANKLAYMLNIAEPDHYIDILLPFSRYRSKLGDWEWIRKNVEAKKQEDYLSYWISDYCGQGFYGSPDKLTDEAKCVYQDKVLGEYPMGKKSRQYLCKSISYCKERDIPITIFIAPMYDLQLISTINYDNYINEVREIAEEYEIPFYDFNLAKKEYLPLWNDDHYKDLNHLNAAGAEVFTSFLGQVIQQEDSENEKYFYDSYAEKLRETEPEFYGIYFGIVEPENEETGETEKIRNFHIASNRDAGMEYKVILTSEKGEQYMVQDFSENKEFSVPMKEHGVCTIAVRMTAHPDDVVQTMEIDY